MLLVVMNSIKSRQAIFGDPLSLPFGKNFSLVGYQTVLGTGGFEKFIANSVIVTTGTVAAVLLLGSMAAFALARYHFRGSRTIGLYLLVGILLPTHLGSVVTLQLMVSLGLINNLLALILVYTAQSLPVAVFILSQFLREIPSEIVDAAHVDGAGELAIYRLLMPLVRPAIATVAVLTMIPAWNDLWWPLILAPSKSTMTLILGAQQFIGEFQTDWNALLAALTIAMGPVLVLYALFSRQLIRGLTSGAVK